jgi:hypothetical protein
MLKAIEALFGVWRRRCKTAEGWQAPASVMVVSCQEEILARCAHFFFGKGTRLNIPPWPAEDLLALVPEWEEAAMTGMLCCSSRPPGARGS